LVVIVDMENTSTKAQALGGNRFKLRDDEGRVFEPDAFEQVVGSGVLGSIHFGKDVNPGLTSAGCSPSTSRPMARGSGWR
jgi:hypothetical protein